MIIKKIPQIIILFFLSQYFYVFAQQSGTFNGNTQFEAQTYKSDTKMEAPRVSEQIQSSAYFNLNYRNAGLTAGIRYEYYLNPMQGIDPNWSGHGIANRFFSYTNDFLEVTAGNFYEQFGSGMIFRTYEEKSLGLDNSIDGGRFRLKPLEGLEFVGV